jgi:hypothetical protein
MTTRSGSTTDDTTTTPRRTNGGAEPTARERASQVASEMVGGGKGAAGTVADRLPEAAAMTKSTVDEAARLIEGGSDQTLIVGAAMSVGFAAGLLVGGAPRLLVTAALVPAVAMGMTLIDRNSGMRHARGRETA